MNFFYQQVKSLLKIPEIRKRSQLFHNVTKTFTAVLELKNPSSLIFAKIGETKEQIKEKKRQIKK